MSLISLVSSLLTRDQATPACAVHGGIVEGGLIQEIATATAIPLSDKDKSCWQDTDKALI
jgi:hypothetical protein